MGSKRALFTEAYFQNLADAIRTLLKTKRKYRVKDMADAINGFDTFEYDEDSIMQSVNLDILASTDFDGAKETSAIIMHPSSDRVVYFPSTERIILRSLMVPSKRRGTAWTPRIAVACTRKNARSVIYTFMDDEKCINGVTQGELVWSDEFVRSVNSTIASPVWSIEDYILTDTFSPYSDARVIPKPDGMDDWTFRIMNINPDSSPYFLNLLMGSDVTYKQLFDFTKESAFVNQDTSATNYSMTCASVYMFVTDNDDVVIFCSCSIDKPVYDASANTLTMPYCGFTYTPSLTPDDIYYGNHLVPSNYATSGKTSYAISNLDSQMLMNSESIEDSDGNAILAANCSIDDVIPNYISDDASWSLYNVPATIGDGSAYRSLRDYMTPYNYWMTSELSSTLTTNDNVPESDWSWKYRSIEFNFVPTYTGSTYFVSRAFVEGRGGNYSPMDIYVDENFRFYLKTSIWNGARNAISSVTELGNCSGKTVKVIFKRNAWFQGTFEVYVDGVKKLVKNTVNNSSKVLTEVSWSFPFSEGKPEYRASRLYIGQGYLGGNSPAGTYNSFKIKEWR